MKLSDKLFKKATKEYKQGNRKKARSQLIRLLKKMPGHADAHHLLGIIYREDNKPKTALPHLKKSVGLKPNIAAAHHNLGAAFQDLGRLNEAEASYHQALILNPHHVAAKNNLGLVLGRLGRVEEAISILKEVVKTNPRFAEAQNNLGFILQQAGQNEEALIHCQKAVLLDQNQAEFHFNHASALHKTGQEKEALSAYDRCLTLRPGWPRALWARLQALPILYSCEEEITTYRSYWEQNLLEFSDTISLNTPEEIKEVLVAISICTNFFLHYQGYNNCVLQKKFGEVLTRIVHTAYPQYTKTKKPRTENTRQKVRVGFVSAFFYQHTIAKLFGNWIIDLDNDKFESYVYYLGSKFDSVTEQISNAATRFYHLPGPVNDTIVKIDRDELDSLIYLDIGMEPRIQVMAPLRLAPIQATTWGHPVTSGMSNIDVYFSSELMEPTNGDEHYTEKLVRLPNLSINYQFPDVSTIPVNDSKDPLCGNAPIYLCSQSLFKLLPQFDKIFPLIAREVGKCRFWFISAVSKRIGSRFRNRLKNAFSTYGLNAADYVYIFPYQSQEEFYELNKTADVLLDSFLWSGLNSTLEAIACGLPVVTCPGPTMRSRHSAACLWRMEMPELIAADLDDYVSIAVRLVCDVTWSDEVKMRLNERRHRLFSDHEPIRALEGYLNETARNMMG